MTDRFVIYGLVDPRTDEVRYIGKSTSGLKRPERHALPAVLKNDTNRHKKHWILELQAAGLSYTIRVLEVCADPASCESAEITWIARAKENGWALVNLTAGGEGSYGRTWTPEMRAKISSANTGRKHLPRSDAYRAKMRAVSLGKKRTPETCARISAGKLGKKPNLSDGQRAAISARSKRIVHAPLSQKTREQIASKLLGYRASKETKQVIDHTGKLWANKYSAAEELGLLVSQITRCLNSVISTTGGYGFSYA